MAKPQGTAEIKINVPIDQLFLYFYGSTKKMKISSPTKMISNDSVSVTDDVVGSIYRRAFDLEVTTISLLPQHESTQVKEITRKEYDFTILDYLDTPDQKKITESYTMDNLFTLKAEYFLKRIDVQTTSLQYTYSYSFSGWFSRLMFRFNSKFDPNVFLQGMKDRIETDFK